MQIILSNKLYTIVSLFNGSEKLNTELTRAKEAKVISIEEGYNTYTIEISDDFILDIAAALIKFGAPLAGILSTAYNLGFDFSKTIQGIGDKYLKKAKKEKEDEEKAKAEAEENQKEYDEWDKEYKINLEKDDIDF